MQAQDEEAHALLTLCIPVAPHWCHADTIGQVPAAVRWCHAEHFGQAPVVPHLCHEEIIGQAGSGGSMFVWRGVIK